MRTSSPAFSKPVRDGRIDVDRPEDDAGKEQRRRGDHSDKEQLAELSLETFECVFIH